jgi:transposase
MEDEMGKKELVGNRQYTDEFKVEAVRLGESIGGNQAAKRLGIPESSLRNWIRHSRAGKLKTAGTTAAPVKRSVAEVEAENARLRKELASTKLDL